jgi:hypothetical protein
VGSRGVSDEVERHGGRKSSVGGVRVPDALPSSYGARFDITVLISFSIAEQSRDHAPYNVFSSAAPYKGFARDFSLQPKHDIFPMRFRFGNQLKQRLQQFSALLGDGQKPPFSLKLPHAVGITRVIPYVDKYGTDLVVAGLRYTGTLSLSTLREMLPSAAALVKTVSQLADTRLARAMAASIEELAVLQKHRVHTSFAISSARQSIDSDVAEFLMQHRREIVALHITGDPSRIPDPRLENALVSENAELNLKSESQLLLLNAQGSTLISAVPTELDGKAANVERGSIYFNRHERIVDLGEIAAAMQHILIRARVRADIDSTTWAGDAHVIERWIRYPKNVLFASVSQQKAWLAFCAAYSLPELFAELIYFDKTEPANQEQDRLWESSS